MKKLFVILILGASQSSPMGSWDDMNILDSLRLKRSREDYIQTTCDRLGHRIYKTICNRAGNTPQAHESNIRTLINEGANTNYIFGSCSLLYWAATFEDEIACKILLEHGADPNLQIGDTDDWRGMTPLTMAIRQNLIEVSILMIEKGAKITPKDGTECNALYWACTKGNIQLCKLLIQKEANINEDLHITPNREGKTPLMIAMAGNKTEICKLLITHGADQRARTQSAWKTPLICGAETKSFESCLALIRHILLPSKNLARELLLCLKRNCTNPNDCPSLLYKHNKAFLAHYVLYNLALAKKNDLMEQLENRTRENYRAFDYFSIELLNPQFIDKTIQFMIRNELQDRHQ